MKTCSVRTRKEGHVRPRWRSPELFADSVEINAKRFISPCCGKTAICIKKKTQKTTLPLALSLFLARSDSLSPESFITGGHFRRYQMCQTFTLITPSDGSPGFNGSNLSVPRRLPIAQTITTAAGREEGEVRKGGRRGGEDEEGMNKSALKRS